MQANIKIVTKQQVFPSGTIGGKWLWKMVESKTDVKSEWSTVNPQTSVAVKENTTYDVCGQRVDPQNELLGSTVCVHFETGSVPGDVVIETADSMSVDIV